MNEDRPVCCKRQKLSPFVPEIIGGTQKIWEVPEYAHARFTPKFLMALVCTDPVNIPAKFEVRSFTRS